MEEDAEVILDPPLHISPDKRGHLQGAGRGVGHLVDVCLQRLGIPLGYDVLGGYLLYVII